MIQEERNNQAIILRLKSSPKNAKVGIVTGFHRLGNLEVLHARKLIRKGPKTGRLYSIPGRKRRHRASAPGQSPANLFGNLARSIGYQIYGDEMSFMTRGNSKGPAVQINGVSYGGFLENKNRPFLSKTVSHFDSTAENIFNDEIYENIK